MSAPCDLHEMSNCGICNGDAKRFDESIKDALPKVGDPTQPLPRIPGGVSIYSQFDGHCAGCGRRYLKDTPIFRPSNNETGWVVIECCA